MLMPDHDNITKTIYYCLHCGELCKGKYCNMCSTAAGRKEVDSLNEEIKKENLAKGFVYN